MRCMHAHSHRRKDQLPLRSLRDLRFLYVFAHVRPRLARWEYRGPRGTRGIGDKSVARFILYITF